MNLSERTLKKWRRESLKEFTVIAAAEGVPVHVAMEQYIIELHKRILRLTQELLDNHLLRRKS